MMRFYMIAPVKNVFVTVDARNTKKVWANIY